MTTTREAQLEAKHPCIGRFTGQRPGHKSHRSYTYSDGRQHYCERCGEKLDHENFSNIPEGYVTTHDLGDYNLTAISTPATEPQGYVDALEEALRWYGENARLCRLIHSGGDAGRYALSADGGQLAKDALGSNIPQQFHTDEANQSGEDFFAARCAPQPAAVTRVIEIEKLELWAAVIESGGMFSLRGLAEEIRAIIGNATPAPSDKIAEAARVLLEWWNTIDQDDPDMDVVLEIMGIMNGSDDDDRFDAALRALAGQG